MKSTFAILAFAVCLTGCSLFGPSSTVKSFMSAAENRDIEGMTKLFSQKVLKEKAAQTRSNNENFSELVRKAIAAGEHPKVEIADESRNGDTANVSIFYRDREKNDSMRLEFKLIKESGSWKIDEIKG